MLTVGSTLTRSETEEPELIHRLAQTFCVKHMLTDFNTDIIQHGLRGFRLPCQAR